MRRDFTLENGIYCKGLTNDFKLYFETMELTPSCSDITYIPNTLLVYKSGKTVHACEPKISYESGEPKLREIIKFEVMIPYGYALIQLHGKTYIIDYNLQICRSNPKKSF